MNGVTVIICCYNSASRITETLEFLIVQQVPNDVNWEIVVVNNASTDDTVHVVKAFCKKHAQSRIRLVDETSPGLAAARQRGVDAAAYDLLIFCDDDNHLAADYLQEAILLMEQHPDVGIVGGWIKPKLPFYPGTWIESNYSALAIGRQAAESGYVDWVFGAGMIIKKEILEAFRQKGILFMLNGRLGAKQTYGDDGEMCRLARFIGYKIYYSNSLILHHKISPHRLTRWSFIKANFKNVYPVIYFYLLETLIDAAESPEKKLYAKFIRSRLHNLIFFSPRMILGKHKFYAFMMFFQTVQSLFWIITRKKLFYETSMRIKNNLQHGR